MGPEGTREYSKSSLNIVDRFFYVKSKMTHEYNTNFNTGSLVYAGVKFLQHLMHMERTFFEDLLYS